jgi:peptidoglycan glycosyltransferase
MTKELNRVTFALLAIFVIIAISASYWATVEADSMLDRPDNLRRVIQEQSIRRGTIYDRNGERLAYNDILTMPGEITLAQRMYPYPEAASAVGYYSYNYGTAGIEKVFNDDLTGANALTEWGRLKNDALHRTQVGADVLSTIDLDVQIAVGDAMAGTSGAAVVVEVPSGRVIAMVSHPGFDPNVLDSQWDLLTEDKETSPLLNRVTAGLYQPGGALQTIILAAMLSTYPDLTATAAEVLNVPAPNARQPVEANGLTLRCLDGVPDRELTLAEAYVFGCPYPFASAVGNTLTPNDLWDRFDVLGLLDPPTLAGFDPAAGELPPALNTMTSAEDLIAAAVGQSELTVTPLQMVQIIAAIANGGNAIPLHLVDALREPGSDTWESVDSPTSQPALLRTDVAAALRLAMLQAAAQSPCVRAASRGDLVLYGHCAAAYSGPAATSFVWFTGFVDLPEDSDATALAVVVVIEKVDDPLIAAQVAGAAFETAIDK